MILARRAVVHETEGSGQTQTPKQSLTPVIERPGTEPTQGKGQMVGRHLVERPGGAIVTLEQVHEGRGQALRELEMIIEEAGKAEREDFVEYARKGVRSLVCEVGRYTSRTYKSTPYHGV